MSLDGNYDAPRPTLSPESQAQIKEMTQKRLQAGGTKVKYGANCGSGNIPKYAIPFPTTPTAVPKYGINSGNDTVPTMQSAPTTPTAVPKYGLNIGGSTATPKYGLNCGVRGM